MRDKKRYCKNCKWSDCDLDCTVVESPLFSKIILDPRGRPCRIIYNSNLLLQWFPSYTDGKTYLIPEANKDYACPFYKTKWWKFWIKVKVPVAEIVNAFL